MADEITVADDGDGLDLIETPCLLLDADRVKANVAALRARLDGLGVVLRPHLKTAKSRDVARIAMANEAGPATVSTLREAEYFAEGGVRDMIYAVGIAPQKLERVGWIRRHWQTDLAIVLDSPEQAEAVAAWSRRHGDRLPVLIEVDVVVAVGGKVAKGGPSPGSSHAASPGAPSPGAQPASPGASH